LLLPVLSAAIIVCAAAALVVVGLDDRRLSSERHAALRLALDEVHAVFGEGDRFGDGKLRLIERPAGLKDLRFATDPPTTADREAQSLHDRDGRIVGWFSWAPDRALARIMNKLWVLAGWPAPRWPAAPLSPRTRDTASAACSLAASRPFAD
jgi:hypothetical protein